MPCIWQLVTEKYVLLLNEELTAEDAELSSKEWELAKQLATDLLSSQDLTEDQRTKLQASLNKASKTG